MFGVRRTRFIIDDTFFYAVKCNIMTNIISSPSCRGTRSQLQVIKSVVFPWGAAMRGNMSFVRTGRIGQWDDHTVGSGSYVPEN